MLTVDELRTLARVKSVLGNMNGYMFGDDTADLFSLMLAMCAKYERIYRESVQQVVYGTPATGGSMTISSSSGSFYYTGPSITTQMQRMTPPAQVTPAKPKLNPLPVNEINECFRKAQDWEDFGRRIEAKHNITLQGEAA